MAFQQYKNEYRAGCIEAFDSNLDKYFAPSEREEFIEYLDSLDGCCEYYVYVRGNRVLACGGICINSTVASLAWGMVHRDFQGEGLGTILTDYRLSKLKANAMSILSKLKLPNTQKGFTESEVL